MQVRPRLRTFAPGHRLVAAHAMQLAGLTSGFLLVAALCGGAASPLPERGRLPAMPDGCQEQLYCGKKHPLYPQEQIDGLLQKFQVSLGRPRHSFLDRDGTDSDFQDDCKSTFNYTKIYEIRDGRGDVRAVVQSGNFFQQVRIEKCQSPGPVTHATDFLSPEDVTYNSVWCEDNFASFSFLVLSLDGTRLETLAMGDVFPVFCATRLRGLRKRRAL